MLNRGKASGLLGLAAGGGAVMGALVLTQVPNLLATHGSTDSDAGSSLSSPLYYLVYRIIICMLILWV